MSVLNLEPVYAVLYTLIDIDLRPQYSLELPYQHVVSAARLQGLNKHSEFGFDRSWKVAPALACGCTIVMKPSEITPLTALVSLDTGARNGVYD